MNQRLRSTVFASVAIVGLAGSAFADKRLSVEPIIRAQVSDHRSGSDDDFKKSLAITGLLTIAGGLALYTLTRKGSMFGDDD